MPTCLSQTQVVGRKPHKCFLCGEMIPKGELHRVFVGVFDGELQRSRYHAECDRVTVIDEWHPNDWEDCADHMEFAMRRNELRSEGKLHDYAGGH